MGGGSIGFQAGVQDAEVMLMIMSDKGLSAVMDNQFKLGADATATFVDLGGGIEGATTAALRADIVGFTRARGLFAGISLGGSLMNSKSDWNQAYYGRPMAAQQIVITMEATNPAADPLRQVLDPFRPATRGRGGACRTGAHTTAAAAAAGTGPAAAIDGSAALALPARHGAD